MKKPKVIRLTENDVERLVKKIINEEQKPHAGTHGSVRILIDDETVDMIESGQIELDVPYTISSDNELWVWKDDKPYVKSLIE